MNVTTLRNSFPAFKSWIDENFSIILGLILVQLQLIPKPRGKSNSCYTYSNSNFLQFFCNNLNIHVFFYKIHLITQKINQINFISELFNYTNNLPTPIESKLKIFRFLREISIIEFNRFSVLSISNLNVIEILFSISLKFRFIKIVSELLTDFFKGPNLTNEKKNYLQCLLKKK